MKNLTSRLYLSGQTVFTTKEIALLWQENNSQNLKSKIHYYCDTKILKKLRRGIYALAGRDYVAYELAGRIYTPSYISTETVLAQEGVNFQYYKGIFSVTYQTREVIIENQIYTYRTLAGSILTNPLGLINRGSYWIASKERAFLDTMYLFGSIHFDHLHTMDWNLCRRILPIYHNKSLVKKFKTYARS